MSRTKYRVVMRFRYKDTDDCNGLLDYTVNAKSYVKKQVVADRCWLAQKGHEELTLNVFSEKDGLVYSHDTRGELSGVVWDSYFLPLDKMS